ncbi:MAG: phage portal protein [Candidatus Paceibacterota bacterium]|jgi:HK97 family phage portal protein
MSFFDNLFSKIGLVRKSFEGLKLAPMYGLGFFFSKTKVSQAKLMSEAAGWVFSCISRISETVISERLRLYRKTGEGAEDWEEITSHPFLDLLQRPNSWMPGYELIQTWSEHEDLTGNAYWLLDGVTDENSIPTRIYPLNPAYMTAVVGSVSGDVDKVVSYEYQTGATKKVFKPFEILHFRRINPNDPFRGLGPTEGSMDSVDTDNWMREWNRRFFQNSAIPGVILETEDTSSEAVRLLRESFEDRHAGVERAHKTVALPRGVKLAKMGYGQKDMDFVESRAKNRDEILAAFGVPPIVLGMGLGESINRATAETQEYVYAKYTIKPKLKRFEAYINEFLLSRFGEDIAIAFDDNVPQNVEQNLKLYTSALGGASYMTINEVRTKEGLEPIEGGDTLPQPATPQLYGLMQSKKKKVVPNRSKSKKKTNDKMVDSIVSTINTFVQSKKKNLETITTVDWLENWKAFVGRTLPQEEKMREAMADYAKGMTVRAMEAVRQELKAHRRAMKSKGVDIAKILNKDDEIALIIEGINPIYLSILKTEGVAAATLVGAAFDEKEKRMLAALKKAIGLMAESYTQTTLDTLKTKLEAGLAEGEGLVKLTETVRTIGEWSETSRAERVAKTEAFRTANFATKEAWKQSNVVKTIKWYTAEDEKVCPYCFEFDGKIVGIDKDFAEKGDTIIGVDLEGNTVEMTIEYANIEAGSLHPNCRCYVRPDEITIE